MIRAAPAICVPLGVAFAFGVLPATGALLGVLGSGPGL
jgi:hypothetical protein